MPKSTAVQAHRLRSAAIALLLAATSCAQLPPTSSVVIPPVPGGAARIWIYRNDAPNEPNQTPYARLNGQIAGGRAAKTGPSIAMSPRDTIRSQ